MIDPMVSLAFAVYSNKGAYALLLGSGISRSSGIPTGWEVVMDLIRKVATLEEEDCEPDPAAWFRNKHGTEPDYSQLLDIVAKTPTERQRLLRSYFEPTEDERSQGLKLPSPAHRAIAQLAATGYLRVIITTNFDRLTEKALEEAGIFPTVISTADQLAGAMPLVHSGVTVIKLHGDYLDTRIKNTEGELAAYEEPMDKLLDRVLDEYGMIISGWSGDWDIALRTAIERCPSRRFTTFWTTRSALGDRAKLLADHRKALILQVNDANHLFTSLSEKVQALDDLAAPHPLSAKMAAVTVKRYLVDPSAKIRLHDLFHEETEKIFAEINDPAFVAEMKSSGTDNPDVQMGRELKNRMDKLMNISDILLSISIAGSYWANKDTAKILVACIQRLANPTPIGGRQLFINLRLYPSLLTIYGVGIASVASGNYQTLAEVLTRPRKASDNEQQKEICSTLYPYAVIAKNFAQLLPGLDGNYTPVSDHLFSTLRVRFREYLSSDEDYQMAFDRFEYLFGLAHADLNRREMQNGWWGPVGCFAWREYGPGHRGQASRRIETEIVTQGSNWPLLKVGLFGGSIEQLKQAKSKFDSFVDSLPFY